MGGTDPEEVDLLARHARVSVGRGSEHKVVEDGGVGRDPDTAAHHHRHLELVPVLVAAAVRTLDPDLGRVGLVLLLVVDRLVEEVPELPCPGPHRLDVHREEVLVRGASQGHAVELLKNIFSLIKYFLEKSKTTFC